MEREAETLRVARMCGLVILELANQKTPLEVKTWIITGCYSDGSDSDQSEHRIQVEYFFPAEIIPQGAPLKQKSLTLCYKRRFSPHQIQPFHTNLSESVMIYQLIAY